MTSKDQARLSKHICRLLKVEEVHWTLGRTSKGNIAIAFNENNDDFTVYLDSIPLSTANILEDENNIELKKMIEKYLFSPEKVSLDFSAPVLPTTTVRVKPVESKTNTIETPKRGRPAKHGKKAN